MGYADATSRAGISVGRGAEPATEPALGRLGRLGRRGSAPTVLVVVPILALCASFLGGCGLDGGPTSFAGRADDGDVVWVRWTEDDGGSLTGRISETQMDPETLDVEEQVVGFSGSHGDEGRVQMEMDGFGSMEGVVEGETLTLDYPAGDDYQRAEIGAGGEEEYRASVGELEEEAEAAREERVERARRAARAREKAADGFLVSVKASVEDPGGDLPREYCPEVEEQVRFLGDPERPLGTSSDGISEDVSGTLRLRSLDDVRVSGWTTLAGSDEGEFRMEGELSGMMETEQEIDPEYGETGPMSHRASGRISLVLEESDDGSGDGSGGVGYDVVDVYAAGNLPSPPVSGDGLFIDEPMLSFAGMEGCESG